MLLECFTEIDIKNTIGTVVPVPEFEDESNIALMSSISETTDDSKLYISALNVTDHVITLPNKSTIANFSILTSTDMKNIIPIDPQTLALAKMTNPENVKHEINQLIQVNKSNDVKPIKPKPEYEKFWFPTPETCENPNILTPIQREIYDQILHFKNLELCEPKSSDHDRLTFLDQFNWENSVLTNEQRSQVEHLLVKYSDIFAKHRFDVGYNSELQIKLTPEHQRPLYTQGPPTPIHLRKELTIELALMHYFGLITTLSQSKYSSPLFAHRKPSGKLRMLIDLRRINHSLKNDYLNTNFPISNMTDASNHFAGKNLFTKLDCSQAYHCVQMADDISVQLLAFNFSSRTYAYKCLAQGLNKSVTGFSSFIRHYLDPCLAGDMCTQFMDDIGSAVHTFDELIPNLSKIFECIRKSGLKLSPSKCEIGTQKMKFLGNIVTPAGVSPEETKIQKFLRNIRMPQTAKQVKRLIGFVQFFRNYMPSLGDKLLPFYKLLKQDVEFRILDEHRKGLEVLKHDLLQATTITLRLPKPDLQYVILCDASCHGTGFVLMVEDYVNTENKSKTKTYAPVSFGSRLFNEPQLKFSIYYKEFLALYFALDHFAHLLVKYSDIFAKHRFDVGYNSELQIKLTPEHQRPLYTQGPPTPIHLRKELTIELALMHYFGLITTLSQSKYSSPLFAHRKPSGKLRMLIDLRRINHSLKNDYLNTNFPISNMTDASNHFAGKNLFTKLDCSQAYHCVQMADDISVQLLAFNFSSRTYAYKCLAQGLNKSVTGFSSFIRHYLDPCLAGDMCTQFMDDIGSAVHTFDELIPNLSKIFECIRKSGLKLSPSKCEIGTQKMKFLGNIVTPAGVSPEETKIQKFLRNIRMPQTAKQVKRLIGFVQFFRNYMPSLGDKLLPFYKLLKQDVEFRILDEHRKGLEVLEHDLLQATTITLRLPKPDLQYVILCDASCHGTGFVLMVEDYVNTENKGKTKTYAPVSFGSRLFNEPQLKFSIYYKEFLALYFALDHFAHFIWGASKPVIVLTDNRSLTSFFQLKSIPPSVWNFLDRVLAFNIVKAHIPGKANHAADFLSRMQTDPNASLSLRLTDKIPVREIHIDSTAKLPDASLNSIEIKEAFSDQVVMTNEIRQQLESLGLLETYMLKQNKIENSDELEAQAFVRLVGPTISAIDYPDPADLFSDLSDRSEPLDLKLEQEKDPDIQEVKNWITENKIPDLKYASSRRKKYAKQINRLELKDAILYRKFFNDTGQVKYLQYCLPKHLWQEVVYRLHNSPSGGHIGMGRTLEEFRKRFYFPGFTEFFVNIIRNCLTCLQLKKSSSRYQTPPLQPISSLQSFPGEMMQIDIVGPFQSPVYKFVLTGIDVFSKYLFAMPLTNVSADTVARELTKIFFTHSYVPKRILADLGTTFTSKLMHELASLLEIQVSHATLKHPQTIGLVEKSHGALKRILKLNTNEQWSDWHKYVPLATFIHNTSYYSSIGCSPSAIFHGRDPIKPLDLRFSTKALEAISVESDFVTALQDAMLEKFKETKQNIIDAYQRYRGYYDQKALAQPLNLHAFCLLLNPKLTTQSEFGSHSKQVWIPLYRVEKVLTNSNYLIRKVGTIYTQCVLRIRLKPIVPQQAPDDLENLDPTTFMTDPSLGKYRGEPELFDECIPQLLEDFHNPTTEEPSQIQGPSSVQLSVPLGAAPGPVVPPPPPPPPVVPAPHPVVAPAIPIVAPPPADEANEQIDNEDPHRDIQFPDPDA